MKDTLATQAVKGLKIRKDGNVVRVDDGADRQLCWLDKWEAAIARLNKRDVIVSDDTHEATCEAYGELCREVGELCREVNAPIASVIGSSRGDIGPLVREAVSLGLVDEDAALSAYGVDVR